MENTKVVVSTHVSDKYYPDLVVFCVGQKTKNKPDKSHISHDLFDKACKFGDFKGEEQDLIVFYNEDKKHTYRSKRIGFVGVGEVNKKVGVHTILEKMRIAGGAIATLSKKLKATNICIIPPDGIKDKLQNCIYGLTEGLFLGDYIFDKYKTNQEEKDKFQGIKQLRFIVDQQVQKTRGTVSLARQASISACHARDMANEPGNSWTPQSFADYGKTLAKKYSLKCSVYDKKKLEKLKMGGILGVNQGSVTPPKLVIVEYHHSSKAKTVLLVGKGLTFDSGGVSLKPAAGMEDMKFDMCGGAAVLSAMNAIGAEKPACNVVAIVPATDNMSGGAALKPGDIIKHYNKVSSEIINTDAEGRLILADALAYGIEKYSPDCVVDLATLTGAVIVGLGHHYSGLLSNNDLLARQLTHAADKCGEPLWRLPLGKHYRKQIESKVADIKNTGGKAAGTITAAEYLHCFVGDTPWAHLDIAGTAWGYTEKSYIPKSGASGICVRTLVEFVRNMK